MKIIEHPSEAFAWKFTCKECAAVCEADAEDLRHSPGGCDMRGESWEEKFSVLCPVCMTSAGVVGEMIPAIVKKRVRDRGSR